MQRLQFIWVAPDEQKRLAVAGQAAGDFLGDLRGGAQDNNVLDAAAFRRVRASRSWS